MIEEGRKEGMEGGQKGGGKTIEAQYIVLYVEVA